MSSLKLLGITIVFGILAFGAHSAEARYDLGISYEFGRQIVHTESESALSLINVKLFIPWDFLPENPVVKETKITPQLALGYIPKTGSAIVGVEIPLRFYLLKVKKFTPFVDLGAGIDYVNDRLKEIGGDFQFSLLGRIGAEFPATNLPWKKTALSFGMQHYSNGKIVDKPNAGLNYLTLRLEFIY